MCREGSNITSNIHVFVVHCISHIIHYTEICKKASQSQGTRKKGFLEIVLND